MLLTVAYDMMLNAGTQENPFELLLRSLAQVKVCGCVCACVCTVSRRADNMRRRIQKLTFLSPTGFLPRWENS